MPIPRSTKCARCGHPKSDADAFFSKGTYADGSPRLFPICKKCAAVDQARPEVREAARERKRAARRAAGIPVRRRGAAEFCPNGHRKAENLRPGRYDCAACARDKQLARNRAAGVKPRGRAGDGWACGHNPETSMRYVKGRPQGCAVCHRERERGRKQDPEYYRRYVAANRERINDYRRAWRVSNRPDVKEFRRGGALTLEYVQIIKNDPCVYCGSEAQEIDHIIAVKAGGTGLWSNTAPTCRSCNASKQTKDVLHFMLYRQRTGVA